MFSYISALLEYVFPKKTEEDDESKEDFLAEQLLDLEITNQDTVAESTNEVAAPTIPRNAECFQRTGVITYACEEYILIDGMLYFDLSACSINVQLNDQVLYLCYKDASETIVVVRILENQGIYWGEEEIVEENAYNVIEHTVVGEVERRQDRYVYMKNSDLKFSLDNVEATFVPMKGDWLELKCTVQFDENKPSDISAAQVLQVISFKPLRKRVKNAVITDWSGTSGICDRLIYFDKQSLQNGCEPQVGSKVIVEAIESNQGTCTWRVIKLLLTSSHNNTMENKENIQQPKGHENSLDVEKEKRIDFTYPIKFESVDFQKLTKMNISITNNSDEVYVMNKWMVLSKKRDSQVDIKPFISRPMKIYPKQTFILTVTCCPKFLGNSKECFIIMFNGFQLKRFIDINVVDHNTGIESNQENNGLKSEKEKIDLMRNIRNAGKKPIIHGVRPVKPPAFVPVHLGAFPIPDKIWSAVLGDSDQTIYTSDYDRILERLETKLPCLTQDLKITNYVDKWHTLMYMEEIQANISMRSHDTPKAFLIRCQEYLGIEISGLSEKRPSLIKGDKVIVKDVWDHNAVGYEGYIHVIKGNLVLMKFNAQFHETYSGTDVSLEFHFNRSTYRRSHQAINLAVSHLGPDILFPNHIVTKTPQLEPHYLEHIKWFNDSLNSGQKTAVTNILRGECRPLPYCIYGPPGTGKTVTVVETILQILTLLPDSRILVATPSNSAANLLTERLIQYRKGFSDSIIRLIANYLLDTDNIPNVIKPYCATMDIAREETAKPKHFIKDDGINLNCRTSFIGRHRVTIGTCYCLGTLAQMGLPRGHFTHIVVDEAGQATEPEIMIPLTFVDKENSQIILAGDPMQLGPVVMSKYSKEYGLEESYLSRLLETFPYQRDYAAYENGFNNKLVTKLNDNYRSLEEVLKLPSEMFYDGTLVPNLDRNEAWIPQMTYVVSEIFDASDSKSGGIFVYGIRGCNARAEDSPSWFNPQEASMVMLTVCKLFKKGISEDDIGVITPYIAQIKYLRVLFDAMGIPQPKIGTVEEFQGQERPIILISTVRSSETYLQEDNKHTLGFVQSPKRLNVAITRARVACLLFCNPHLLSTDPLWKKVIEYAVKEDKYMGCDLPLCFK